MPFPYDLMDGTTAYAYQVMADLGACAFEPAAAVVTTGSALTLLADAAGGRQIVAVQQVTPAPLTINLPVIDMVPNSTEFLIVDVNGVSATYPITITAPGALIRTATGLQVSVTLAQNGGRLDVIWHGGLWSVA